MHLDFYNPTFCLLLLPFLPYVSSCPFYPDAAPSAAGAPGAPMSVKAYDINSDYVLVAWKPPNTVNEAAINGYFVDRSVRTLKTLQASFYSAELAQ